MTDHPATRAATGPAGPDTERSTCEHCGQPIVRRGGADWMHVDGLPVTCSTPGRRATGVATPVQAASTLRVLLLALLHAGLCEIDLYDDGFEVSGPDDVSLVHVRGAFTPTQVSALLGVDADGVVNDYRTGARPAGTDDDRRHLRHNVTAVGEAAAWRYLAAADIPSDHSDHFWLAALGVEVLVRRRDDGVFVAVNDEGIAAGHGPLVVQVNEGDAIAHGVA